jgi:hypothetical protein
MLESFRESVFVNTVQVLDMEALFTPPVWAEPVEQGRNFVNTAGQIEGKRLGARRKADRRGISLAPAFMPIVVSAEADDARASRGRDEPGHIGIEWLHSVCHIVSLSMSNRILPRLHRGIADVSFNRCRCDRRLAEARYPDRDEILGGMDDLVRG